MIEWLTPFKLFALWAVAVYLLWRKIQATPLPPEEPDHVDLTTVREAVRRQEWRERLINERLAWHWVRWE